MVIGAKELVEQGNASLRQGCHEQALRHYEKALVLAPDHPGILNNYAAVLERLDRLDEAFRVYERLQARSPPHAGVLANGAVVLMKLQRLDEALARIEQALSLAPQYAEAFNIRGNVLFRLRRLPQALESYDRADSLRPGHPTSLVNRALVLQALKRYKEADLAFVELLRRQLPLPGGRQHVLNNRLRSCDWTDYAALLAEVVRDIENGQAPVDPFYLPSLAERACSQLEGARTLSREYGKTALAALEPRPLARRSDRIRVAYVCADFGNRHAIWYLTKGLFESHDRTRFEITGVSIGPSPGDAPRHFDEWIDASRLKDVDVARLLRQRQVDIAVDLNGFSGDGRPAVFAHRAAPVQISWLAYPGTMGMQSMDYIVADHHVIPPGCERFYTESVIRLPDAYQANNHRNYPIERPSSRADNALPEHAFVFCCFNNNYKIRPALFDVWMRLLRDIDGSVLWLLGDSADAIANLRREAETRGVAAARLIFAARTGGDAHLARQGCADLFLDTFPYTAHTTATDALWAGLPVLTLSGETFASRVAGSLLNAAGLPELVTTSLAEYERMARDLATKPGLLGQFRDRLRAGRPTCRLFDLDRLRNHLETAYRTAHDRHGQGLPPGSFDVEPAAE